MRCLLDVNTLDIGRRIEIVRRIGTVIILLAVVASLPGWRPPRADEGHDEARKLRETGVILPLEVILQKARQLQPGRVVETELEREQGRYIYEIKIVDEKGVLHEVKFDAKTAEPATRNDREKD